MTQVSNSVETTLIDLIERNVPGIQEYTGAMPPNDFMDQYYTRWVRVTKQKDGTKVRHMSKVDNSGLRYVHSSIARHIQPREHDTVHSYRKKVSAVTCAEQHIGSYAIFCIDIKDFFPSITLRMIQKIMIHHGCSKKLARYIAITTTASDPRNPAAEPRLPLGISLSGVLSNSVLYDLDVALSTLCDKAGYTYTRYSDNMYISSVDAHIPESFREQVITAVNTFKIAGTIPFVVNTRKTKYLPHYRRQRILGVVINTHLNISSHREKWIRSSINHLFTEARDIQNGTVNDTLNRRIRVLSLKARRVRGVINHLGSIRKDKFEKYRSMWYLANDMIECARTTSLSRSQHATSQTHK